MESVCGRGAHIHANQVLALMSKIFNFAIERDWLQTNPCQMIKAPAKNVQRDRLLTEDEIAKFWEATEHEQPTPRAAIGRMREARLCPPRVAPKTRRRARRLAGRCRCSNQWISIGARPWLRRLGRWSPTRPAGSLCDGTCVFGRDLPNCRVLGPCRRGDTLGRAV